MTQARSAQPIRGQNRRHCSARRLYALNNPQTSQLSHLQRQETLDRRDLPIMQCENVTPGSRQIICSRIILVWNPGDSLNLQWKTYFPESSTLANKVRRLKKRMEIQDKKLCSSHRKPVTRKHQANDQSKDAVAEKWLLPYKLFICILIRP